MGRGVTNRLEAYFRARPNVWIDGMELAKVGGCYGWRSRFTDLRQRGMEIQNRQERVTVLGNQFTKSYYRYVPEAPGEANAVPHDLNEWVLRP